jgi:rRNA processing protein Krr1/Pno1
LSKKARKQKKKLEAAAETVAAVQAPVDEDGWTTVPTTRPQKLDQKARFGDAKNIVKEEVSVPTDQHGILMGKGGANLAALEQGTDTIINLPAFDKRNGVAASKWVAIRGTPENVARAKKGIADLLEKGFCKYTHPGETDGYVECPIHKRSFVIGPKGAFIDALKHETGAKITMPDRQTEDTTVKLFGERQAVQMAKKYILELITEGYCEVTHPGWEKDEIDFPLHKIGRLMGKKASKLRAMEAATGCRITTPDKNDHDTHGIVVVCGPAEGVIRARMLILQASEDDPEDIILDEVDPEWAAPPHPSFYEW